MPTGANLPGFFTRPGERFQLIKHRLKQRIMDLREWALPPPATAPFVGDILT